MTDKKRWRHTNRLNVKDHGPHEPEPYARITDDGSNRCVTCGDYIVELKPVEVRKMLGYPPESGPQRQPTVVFTEGELEEMYKVAEDDEIAVLDRVAERAGIIWICPVRPWNNPKGEPCGDCGLTEEVARAGADRALDVMRGRVGEGRTSMRGRVDELGEQVNRSLDALPKVHEGDLDKEAS